MIYRAAPEVQLALMNVSSQVVQQQPISSQTAGIHTVTLSLRDVVGGFYMYRIVSETGVQAGKCVKQ